MDVEKIREQSAEFRMMAFVLAKNIRESHEIQLANDGLDITGLQFGVLMMLNADGEHSLVDLSKKFMIDSSTLVPTIDALERKGMLTRHRDANDRRRVVIALTDKGADIARSTRRISDDDPLFKAMLAMGGEKIEQLLILMRSLILEMPEGDTLWHNICNRLRINQVKTQQL